MTEQRFQLVAEIGSDDPAAIEPPLRQLAPEKITETAAGFHVEATMTGNSARDLNRELLSTPGATAHPPASRIDRGRRHPPLLRLRPQGNAAREQLPRTFGMTPATGPT
jgi:hypothetical protein